MSEIIAAHMGENAREISYDAFSREPSKTAASASNRIFGSSGAMDYRVVLKNGKALSTTVVNAASGDDAADAALRKNPGLDVVFVGPATKSDAIPVIDMVDGE